jgi:hypothetical protein
LIVDEDLAGMYLTAKSRGRQRDVDQHDEVELLLEAYVKQVDGIVQEADQLVSNMRNTEEIVNIILDANRNSLMLLDLKVPFIFNQRLITGINDDIRNWFRSRNSRFTRYESQKFHRRLGIRISINYVSCLWNEYASLWIWPYKTQKDTKVDVIWTVSWS